MVTAPNKTALSLSKLHAGGGGCHLWSLLNFAARYGSETHKAESIGSF
jgi:hypothetical protein